MNGDRLVDVLSVGDGTLTLVTRSRDGGTDVSTQLLEGVTESLPRPRPQPGLRAATPST